MSPQDWLDAKIARAVADAVGPVQRDLKKLERQVAANAMRDEKVARSLIDDIVEGFEGFLGELLKLALKH